MGFLLSCLTSAKNRFASCCQSNTGSGINTSAGNNCNSRVGTLFKKVLVPAAGASIGGLTGYFCGAGFTFLGTGPLGLGILGLATAGAVGALVLVLLIKGIRQCRRRTPPQLYIEQLPVMVRKPQPKADREGPKSPKAGALIPPLSTEPPPAEIPPPPTEVPPEETPSLSTEASSENDGVDFTQETSLPETQETSLPETQETSLPETFILSVNQLPFGGGLKKNLYSSYWEINSNYD